MLEDRWSVITRALKPVRIPIQYVIISKYLNQRLCPAMQCLHTQRSGFRHYNLFYIYRAGGRVTNTVETIFRKIFEGTRARPI